MARVMVVFGGRSGEHEVSLASARAILEALERGGRHEAVPVGITREGRWLHTGDPMRELETGSIKALPESGRVPGTGGGSSSGTPAPAAEKLPVGLGSVDVVFPVLHGPFGEDGTIQGMLELAGVPYVGSGVLASAVGMDKITMKKVFAQHGLPQVDWLGLTRARWTRDRAGCMREIEAGIDYPVFVKPANLGSSVGISKATDAGELEAAIEAAAGHDRRIIVEAEVDAREIEVSVLGNDDPKVSVPGEILVTANDFYDYEAKYTEGASEVAVPADIPEDVKTDIQKVAATAFEAIDAAGMARVDFFLERDTQRLLLNEINTIPGFTPMSVYAKLWAASGLPYEELVDRLISLALERHQG
jgi:D-alanine-D-alanine ligase